MDSGPFCGDEGIDLSLQKEKYLSNDSAKFRLFWERECNQCYQRIRSGDKRDDFRGQKGRLYLKKYFNLVALDIDFFM